MLEFKNVTKRYQRRAALQDIDLTLPSGKTCLLLGPNGAGKTTLMKLAAGLARPTSGEVLFDGHPIGIYSKARVAYMPTENYFYSYMTIRDAGKYYADFFEDFSLDGFYATLDRMELDRRDRVRHLSSGMGAKLRLALTLNRNAELMMFDEPLNGVDILTRKELVDAMLAARQANRTMLISTHLVDELETVVDACVFIKNGRVLAAGDRADVCGDMTLMDKYLEVFGHSAGKDGDNHA